MQKVEKITVRACCSLILFVLVFPAGCITPQGSQGTLKVSAYRPDESGRDVWTWSSSGSGGGLSGITPLPALTNGFTRALSKGDKVKISLTGIPQPQEIENVVNDFGLVTLPLIGSVRIEGLTTAKAEQQIRHAYISKQFYKSIDVIVVAQEGEFFVRGEVKNEGVFPVSGDVTLMQAIIMSSGYTDYAKKSEIKVIRGRETTVYDAEKIEKREMEDPLIRTGDIIVVPRRIF